MSSWPQAFSHSDWKLYLFPPLVSTGSLLDFSLAPLNPSFFANSPKADILCSWNWHLFRQSIDFEPCLESTIWIIIWNCQSCSSINWGQYEAYNFWIGEQVTLWVTLQQRMQNILVKSCHFLDLKPFGDVPSPLELPILNYILGWGKVREEGLGMAGTLKEVFESLFNP